MGSTGSVRRVLLTADTVGGVWSYALELCRGLTDRGVQVTLASMGAELSARQREDLRVVGPIDLRESRYRLEWMEAPWEDVRRASEWLLELEEEVRPEVVHLNQFSFGALRFRAPKLVVGHSCVYSWCEAVQHREPAPSFYRYREEVGRGLQGADRVVAPSQAMLAKLDRFYGPLPRTQVIYNARSPHEWRPGPRKEPVIFAAGRLWDEAKNLGLLAKVAERLPWPVRIAGDTRGPDGGDAFDPRGATLLGTLSAARLAEELSAAAIYAFPARYEPFGLSILEAGLSGCALVLGDLPSLREVWGDAAVYVPPEDEGALVEALGRLIADPERRAMLGEQARQRGCQYSPRRMVEAYLQIYRALGRSNA